jgi:hypothetical protein
MPLTSRKAKVMSQLKANLEEDDTDSVDTQYAMPKDDRYVAPIVVIFSFLSLLSIIY